MHVEVQFNAMAAILTMTDLQARTGLASSALRFYERKGLLRPVGRRGGMRVYEAEAVEQVALIDVLKRAGFTLNEIGAFVDPAGRVAPDWRDRMRTKIREIDQLIQDLTRARLILEHTVRCPHERLDDCPKHRSFVHAHATTLASR
jgi:DNA-binding transcriptional MerR regulator